jgi:peptidoglycan/LPS O-acetylase OafA/YrhL
MGIIADKSGRVPALDGVRGIAILLVLLQHYFVMAADTQPGSMAAYVLACFRLSWTGVDLFFVLSGFLIGGILLDLRDPREFFGPFWIRRICRIFPLYFLLVAAFFALLQVQHISPWTFKDPLPWLSYVTFTQNIVMAKDDAFGANGLAPSWSLAVEEQFYLFLPFLVRYCSARRLPWVLAGAVASAPLLRTALGYLNGGDSMADGVLTPCRSDELLWGVLLAWMVRRPAIVGIFQANCNALWGAFVVLVAGFGFWTVHGELVPHLGLSWLGALYGCLILLAVTARSGPLHNLLTWKPLRGLGSIAYGVYLLHVPILGLSYGLILHQDPRITNLTNLAVTFVALGATIGIAAVSFRYFEAPIIRFGRGFTFSAFRDDLLTTATAASVKVRAAVPPET